MDVAVNHDRRRVLAVRSRQFAPSRIERQLLTQVFEWLCNSPTQVEHPESADRGATKPGSETQGSIEPIGCEQPFARRHVA